MKKMISMGLAAMLTAAAAPATADPAAVLMGYSGDVEVRTGKAGGWSRPVPGMTLSEGDALRVSSGQAKLLRADGRTVRVGTGESHTVSGSRTGASADGTLGRLWSALLSRARLAMSGEAEPSKAGAVRTLDGHIDLVRPRNTSLMAPPKTIAWKAIEGARAYRVTITDGMKRVIARHTVEGTELPLGATAERLEPGKAYFVLVKDDRTGGAESDPVYFRLLKPAERDSVLADVRALDATLGGKADSEVLALARGALYEHWSLLDDALLTYERAGAGSSDAIGRAIDLVHVKTGRRWAMGQR